MALPHGMMADWARIWGDITQTSGTITPEKQGHLYNALAAGGRGYQRFQSLKPPQRQVDFFSQKAAIHRWGRSELWDFGRVFTLKKGGVPFLLVPSLMGGSHIFAIGRTPSFVEFLCQEGFHPYIVHWGRGDELDDREIHFTIQDYVQQRLIPMAEAVSALHGGQSIHLLGYCMGAILGLAALYHRSSLVNRLTLLAPPFDMGAGYGTMASFFPAVFALIEQQIQCHGYVPSWVSTFLFLMMDPHSAAQKFTRFSAMDLNDPRAHHFRNVEEWVQQGMPLAPRVGHEIFGEWMGQNTLVQKRSVTGIPLNLGEIQIPVCLMTGASDRIVPAPSSRPLTHLIPNVKIINAPLGHLGLLIGSKAPDLLWRPYLDWVGG